MCSGAKELSCICRRLLLNYSAANTWEMLQPQYIILERHWGFTFQRKGGEWQGSVCTIQAALSRASLGMPELQNNRPSSNFTLRMARFSSRRGMHRCRHSAAVNPSKHPLCLTLCSVNATDRLLWARVCCIWVSHSKWRSPLSCCFPSGVAISWWNKSFYVLVFINRTTADGCVITLLLWWAWHGYLLGY